MFTFGKKLGVAHMGTLYHMQLPHTSKFQKSKFTYKHFYKLFKTLGIFKLCLLQQGHVCTCLQSFLCKGGCLIWPKSDVANSLWRRHACWRLLPARQREAGQNGSIQGAELTPRKAGQRKREG